MAEDKLKDVMKRKLEHHSRQVPSSVWDEVERHLPVSVVWYRRPLTAVAIVATVVIAIVASIVKLGSPFFAPHQDVILALVDDSVESVCMADTIILVAQEDNNVINEEAPTVNTVSSNSKRCILEERTIVSCNQDELLSHRQSELLICDSALVSTQEELEGVLCATDEEENITFVPREDDLCSTTVQPADTVLIAIENNDFYDSRLIEQLSGRSGDKSSLSFMVQTQTMSTASSSSFFPLRCGGEAELVFNHNFPVNVEALFEKTFGRWAIGTGISYTFLSSDYELSHNWRLGRQELHYLGIPVYVKFRFAELRRFSFYATAGAQIDFNVSAQHIESPESHLYDRVECVKFRDKRPQVSAQLGLGASFSILPCFDVFVEPSLGYYFDSKSKLTTIWSDRPLNVGITLGLRSKF